MGRVSHVVVIATTDREELLERALASIASQTRAPDRVVLVVDGAAIALQPRAPVVECLTNRRTKGAAGAWNTAIDHLTRTEELPDDVTVSFLDDDDWWEPDHLATVATVPTVEVVATPIVRHDAQTPHGRLLTPPETLDASTFLVGNPGIQGSNLSVRLSTLLEAGCFDEALSSTTDRDLCIRLADLGATYARVSTGIAHHDTLHGSSRLSTPGRRSKLAGLDGFFAKYGWRMTPDETTAAETRARELFEWTRPRVDPPSPALLRSPQSTACLELVVGVIVDGANPARSLPLLDDLARLRRHSRMTRLELVLLENGPAVGCMSIEAHAYAVGLVPWTVRLDAQRAVRAELALDNDEVTEHKSIAVARTLLQRFMGEVALANAISTAWILDDDKRLHDDLDLFVDDLARARASGVDVLIGSVSGAPPIPGAAAVRTQLVDLHAFLRGAAQHGPSDAPPDAEAINRLHREGRRDYYHDLARGETDRLETPFVPETRASSVADAVNDVLGRAERILAGESLSRPLPAPKEDPLTNLQQSSFRGGNTLVFDIELLRAISNLSPRIAGRRIRRSDMIWAAVARFALGRRVLAAPIALEHDRSSEPVAELDFTKLLDDLLGYAFFRAFEEGLAAGTVDRARVLARTRKFAIERLAAFRLAFYRVRGLTRSLDELLRRRPWWLSQDISQVALGRLMSRLRDGYGLDALRGFEERVESALQDPGFERFLQEGSIRTPNARWDIWVAETRAARARCVCGRAESELLGMGDEGVVLRDGDRVFKVFDRWTREERAAHLGKLHNLEQRPVVGLPTIVGIRDQHGVVVLETRYEASRPYTGGEGPQLLELLRSLHVAGWVHTNLHPKNLRVTSRGLELIDLGRSLEPATPEGEERMVRRAFLSFRFWFRTDLGDLARRTIESTDFPELVGWRHLLEAVRGDSPKHRLDAAVADRVRALTPITVLDFGCGKPGAMAAVATAVFDPDRSLAARWESAAPGVPFLDEPSVPGKTFDVVVCTLVLCVLDDAAMVNELGRIRALTSPDGCALVSVCDPTSCSVHATTFQRRTGAPSYRATAPYTKHVGGSASARVEHHRPLAAYRRAFARAGLAILSETTIDGVDIDRFERVAEFVRFELRPLAPLPLRTTLLIKACALEAETVRDQVEHIVSQLGAPRAFDEVALLIDPFEGPFPRQHTSGDLPGLRAQAAQLLAERIIDRVIEGVRDGQAACSVSERWFGLETECVHSENGQPVLGILEAVDLVSGELVFHVDADLMVARPDPQHDPIADASAVFNDEPLAVALSLPVFGDEVAVLSGPFRVDASGGWLHAPRLRALRPLPNTVTHGRLALPWHRSVDLVVGEGSAASLRRGSSRIWCASPDNARKASVDGHLLLLDRVEACYAPASQSRRMEMVATFDEWVGPKRGEPLVVVVCGRNVSPGRISRCMESLRSQRCAEWGAVVIDDASDNGADEVLRREVATLGGPVTFVRRRRRAGLLANTALAIRSICSNPDSVIVLLDLDDALGTSTALGTIRAAHEAGSDVTVGSMVRTDKETRYVVDVTNPRQMRGGNVWQHVRTFRKRLFDRIELTDLHLEGTWIEHASDWAIMIPIVEMATRAQWIREPLYLHEPGEQRTPEYIACREATIGRLLARPSYRSPERANRLRPGALTIVRVSKATLDVRDLVGRFEPVSLEDVLNAARNHRALPERAALFTLDGGDDDMRDVARILEHAGVPTVLFADPEPEAP